MGSMAVNGENGHKSLTDYAAKQEQWRRLYLSRRKGQLSRV